MNALLHSPTVDAAFLAISVAAVVFTAPNWRQRFYLSLSVVWLLAVSYWSYQIVLDLAPDPPTIPCTQGMTLLPHQSCTLRIEISIPHPDGSI